MSNNVNHPAHYTDGKYETIEFIERHGFSFHEGNAIKYISRAGKKDPSKTIEDLEKALWYIKRASNAEDYRPDAITAHDYIIDKKLSPALASALALIEASEYEKAEGMLEAEIKRLEKDESIDEQKDKGKFFVDDLIYQGKVVCISSGVDVWFTPGRVYEVVDGFQVTVNNGARIYLGGVCFSVQHLNALLREKYLKNGAQEANATFIEFKGEV